MLKLIESNIIDPTEFTIVETIIKLVKYGVKSHNGVWAQSRNTQQDVYKLTTALSAERLKDINLILKGILGLEVDNHFILRVRGSETPVELSDRLTDIAINIFGSDIDKIRIKASTDDFYNRCCAIHDIITKNIYYDNYELIELLEAEI